jgi:hypothetical protein
VPRRSAPLAAALLLIAAPALAQHTHDRPDGIEAADSSLYKDWTLRFEPSVWYAAPAGELHLSGEPLGTPDTGIENLNLDSPRLSPFGEFHLRASDRWRFTLCAFAFQAEDRGATMESPGFLGPIAVSAGDRVESSLTFASGEAAAAWRIPYELGRQFEDFEARIELIGGTRFTHFDLDVSAPAGGISEEHFFLEPIVGAKLSMDITERFSVDLQSTFGFWGAGDKSSFSWDILVGFMYFPIDNVGVQIGFRQYFVDLQNEGDGDTDFEYTGALAGLYGGISIRY